MDIGVLGGGLQGCCIAMALAAKGARVTLFDRNDVLLSRAAVANEGKIHLGYMYGGDATLNTARTMMRGALAFMPFMTRHLGLPSNRFELSIPAVYVVHRESQSSVDATASYFSAVHTLLSEASSDRRDAYFGMDLGQPPTRWTAEACEDEFSPEHVLAAFDSPEVAIDPVALARMVRDRIAATPEIEARLRHHVRAVEEGTRLHVVSDSPGGPSRDGFDHVVNALWDGRLAIDDTLGLRPRRPWIHRLKYGVSFRPPAGLRRPRSATFVLGPFGEVVNYGSGLIYLTWYPECLLARSHSVQPPDWPTYPDEALKGQIFAGTLKALSDIVVPLAAFDPEALSEVVVRGGAIVAWGDTDIDDRGSELHRRFEIGVTSAGRYHSVDPGKLTMAPYFADQLADRILIG